MELQDRHVVVTGASRGIGHAMAKHFADAGAKVSVVARSPGPLDALAADIGGHAFTADLGDADAVDALVPRIEAAAGPIDVFVNNAGLETTQPFHTVDAERIRDVVTLNLEAPIVLTRAVLDGMLDRNRGSIVFTSSIAGTGGFPNLAAYCATKAGLTNFAATLAMELKDTNIRTTVVAPGPVATDMWENLEVADDVQPMLQRLNRLQLIPQASPEKIAKLTVSAVAKDKAYVGLPRRLAVNHMLRNLPTKITSLALAGVQLGPRLNR